MKKIYTCKEVYDRLTILGWSCSVKSPNKPPEGQWYLCKLGEELEDTWRIDTEKECLHGSVGKEGDMGLSFCFPLSSLADECGIELCDEFDVNISFYRSNIFSSRVNIFIDDGELGVFNKWCMKKVKKFVKLLNNEVRGKVVK